MSDRVEDIDDPFVVFKRRRERREGRHASAERRPLEKVVARTDGRSARGKGKTETVNYRVTPEWKNKLARLAAEEKITMTEVLERALDVYDKSHRRKR
jgi:hypothetical protein